MAVDLNVLESNVAFFSDIVNLSTCAESSVYASLRALNPAKIIEADHIIISTIFHELLHKRTIVTLSEFVYLNISLMSCLELRLVEA